MAYNDNLSCEIVLHINVDGIKIFSSLGKLGLKGKKETNEHCFLSRRIWIAFVMEEVMYYCVFISKF